MTLSSPLGLFGRLVGLLWPPARRGRPDHLGWWRAAALAFPGTDAKAGRRRLKFVLRGSLRPRATRAWINRLARPDTRPLWEIRPRLATKLQRPYLRRGWTLAARVETMASHYDLLRDRLAEPARRQVFGRGLTLLRLIAPPGGRTVDLRLVYRDQFEKEGEMTLTVEDAETRLTLAALSFVLATEGDRRLAWIGGVQAGSDARVRQLINDAARQLHGLRPKALALWTLRQLTRPWEIEALRAIGDANHVCRHGKVRHRVASSYDEFWSESGGRLRADGDWDLPITAALRCLADIKPSRRRAYERRYAMLAAVRGELLAALSGVLPGEQGPNVAPPRAYLL